MLTLKSYAKDLAALFNVEPLKVFAKLLTTNDDAGRHGLLIPDEAYSFFPDLPIPDPTRNETGVICGYDVLSRQRKDFGWKYYARYPERRVTRLNPSLNELSEGRRLAIFILAKASNGSLIYLADARLEKRDSDFNQLVGVLFDGAQITAGSFVQLPLGAPTFMRDSALLELLSHYDSVSSRGWINTLRVGDTGIGYTFETLIGIEENNAQDADFKGIEIKCKLKKNSGMPGGKINLFQMAPSWTDKAKGIDRLRKIGCADSHGVYSCYSQVTTNPNNLDLSLVIQPPPEGIDLRKNEDALGFWTRERLAQRLAMKHSRAAFIKADSKVVGGTKQYHYNELIYCERPSLDRFVEMVQRRRIVFEFAMTERPIGRVRNHGYPWRLVDERELDLLFDLQIQLRG